MVHLLGRASDEIVTHLRIVTRSLAASGVQQTVVLLDDARCRALLTKFDASVRLVLGGAGLPGWRRPIALLRMLRDEVHATATTAIHLHGLLPGLLGIFAAKFHALPAPLHLTLYGCGPWKHPSRIAARLLRALAPHIEAAQPRPGLVLPPPRIAVVEGTVGEIFFRGLRRELRRPLVVTSSRAADARGAARFAQLAVLLHDEALAPGFNWIGPADAASLAQFNAAGVGQFDAHDDLRRVARLRSAWLYVAAGDASGFPVGLVEAMALGLPCVAWATPQHRAVLMHGETGLLCESADELLTCIANLVDSPSYRERLGQAARLEALRRFHPVGLSSALLAAYQASAAEVHEVRAPVETGPASTSPATRLLPIDR